MANRDIITIGGSAGSLEAIRTIVRSLPGDLEAALFVVMHLSPRARSTLPALLQTELMCLEAADGERVEPGRIYVAPPDRHLVVARDHIHLTRGPKEGLHRPSINVTFRSAAAAYGDRVIGVLLSGMLDDGAAGLWEISQRGGVTVVQDPAEAQFPSMPLNALADANVHYRLPAAEMGWLLRQLVKGEARHEEAEASGSTKAQMQFSGFTCPECHGPLFELRARPPEFRCRVGHILSLKTLLDEHTSAQERRLYEAILALEEGADLAEYTARHVLAAQGEELRKEAVQLRRHAVTIRGLLEERAMTHVD